MTRGGHPLRNWMHNELEACLLYCGGFFGCGCCANGLDLSSTAFVQYLRGRNSVNEAEHWRRSLPGLCFEILRLGLDFGRRLNSYNSSA